MDRARAVSRCDFFLAGVRQTGESRLARKPGTTERVSWTAVCFSKLSLVVFFLSPAPAHSMAARFLALQLVADFLFFKEPHVELVALLATCSQFGAWHTCLQDHLDGTVRRVSGLTSAWEVEASQVMFLVRCGARARLGRSTRPPPEHRLAIDGSAWIPSNRSCPDNGTAQGSVANLRPLCEGHKKATRYDPEKA